MTRRPRLLMCTIRSRRLAAATGLLLASLASSPMWAPPSSASASPYRPASTVKAPYVDVAGPNRSNVLAAIDAGLTHVTAAFVVGHGCTPIWDDGDPVSHDRPVSELIRTAQQSGADVTISFGGAGGKELARTCTSAAKLLQAYRAVIDRFGVTSIDFDIEGGAIDPRMERASISRRFAAIRALQQAMPDVTVSVTLPAGPAGLESSGVRFLRVAEQSGTRLDVVNVMTMDYGGPVGDMAGTAIRGARHALRQVQERWPQDTYANLGITPMIGDNDSADETFTLADAATVASFAAQHGVGRVAFWSLNRDQRCGSHRESDAIRRLAGAQTWDARNDCSGVTQRPLEFTTTFLAG